MTGLVDWTIKATILVGIALVASSLCRGRSAALRHFVLAMGVAAALLLPALALVSPGWELPESAVGPAPGSARTSPRVIGSRVTRSDAARPDASRSEHAGRIASVLDAVPWMWGAGTTLLGLMLGIGLFRLQRVERGASRNTDLRLQGICDEARTSLDVRQHVTLLLGEESSLPITWGFRSPRILLPASAQHWSDDRARVVLLHELAHVGRGDWAIHLAAAVLRAVLWFNPVTWVISRRLRRESESACDDRVLQAGVAGSAYASHLLDLARAASRGNHLLPAAAIVETTDLERRVRVMLNPGINRRPVGRRTRNAWLMAAAAIAISVAGGTAAQNFATFAGSVVDAQNAVLPGVTFTLTQLPNGARYEVKSNREGRVELPGLQAGVYDIEVSLPGFSTLRSRVQLGEGERLEPQLMLQVGSIEETVTVTDDPGSLPRRQALDSLTLNPCPAAQPSSDGVAIGGNIRPPRRTVNVAPLYPPTLSGSGRSASVTLEAQIGTDGRVDDVRIAAGADPDFAAAAVDAVRQWEWTPTLLNCQPVAIQAKVYVNFTGAR